jgi:hypothetical protein
MEGGCITLPVIGTKKTENSTENETEKVAGNSPEKSAEEQSQEAEAEGEGEGEGEEFVEQTLTFVQKNKSLDSSTSMKAYNISAFPVCPVNYEEMKY